MTHRPKPLGFCLKREKDGNEANRNTMGRKEAEKGQWKTQVGAGLHLGHRQGRIQRKVTSAALGNGVTHNEQRRTRVRLLVRWETEALSYAYRDHKS